MSANDGAPWFVLQTAAQQEAEADRRLREELGVITLFPRRHLDLPTLSAKCPRCRRRFSSQYSLDQHLRDGHGVVLVRKIKKAAKARPMMPGYLFVTLANSDASWPEIASVRGVLRVMADQAGRPLLVPAHEMGVLIGMLDEDGFERPKTGDKAWWNERVDKWWLIKRGPFSGFSGKCTAANERGMILEVWIFGRMSPVPMPHDFVELAADAA
jgi:transcription antitermination factor NusG